MRAECLWAEGRTPASKCSGSLAPDSVNKTASPLICAATLLGATIGDRLRINAKWAQRGMFHSDDAAQPLQFVGGLQSRLVRWRLCVQVGLLRLAFWVSRVVHGTTGYLQLE